MIIVSGKNLYLRNTKQRDLVLEVVKNSCDHPSAETIFERARRVMSGISLGTVYRNLGQLSDLGLIRKIPIASDCYRYDKTLEIHAHFYCGNCGAVFDVGDESSGGFIAEVERECGGKVTQCDFLFTGKCKKCLENLNEQSNV